MITAKKIIDEVNRLIVSKYNDYTVYISNVPKGFDRPSFLIDLIFDSSSNHSKYLTEEHTSLQIVYFAPVDDYYISDELDKLSVQGELKSLFKVSYIKVDDRGIKIKNFQSSSRDNEIYITLDFEFVDDREETNDDNVMKIKNIILNQGVD